MKTQYKWAIAASSVLLIGFVSVQQTGALWRDTAESTGGTIQAGMLDISAGGEGVKQFNLDGFKLDNKGPGDSIQMPLPVINSGNVQMNYVLSDVVLNGATPAAAEPARGQGSQRGGPAPPLATWALSSTTVPWTARAFSEQLVPAGQMQVLCLRATLGQGAAASQQSNATFTFDASSVSQS